MTPSLYKFCCADFRYRTVLLDRSMTRFLNRFTSTWSPDIETSYDIYHYFNSRNYCSIFYEARSALNAELCIIQLISIVTFFMAYSR